MESFATLTVNDLTRSIPETLRLLSKYGIDTCCGGARTLAEAAKDSGADLAALEREIAALAAKKPADRR